MHAVYSSMFVLSLSLTPVADSFHFSVSARTGNLLARSSALLSTATEPDSATTLRDYNVSLGPDDASKNFEEGPSVSFWKAYNPPESTGVANLRVAASQAIEKARGDGKATQYWSYHLARSTFFASQAVTGVLAFRLSQRGSLAEAPNGLPGESKGLGSQSPAQLVDTLGVLFAEAVATYSQDWGAVSDGKLALPWDMRDGNHRQRNPLYIADQGRRFISESISILTRRTRRDPKDIGVWMDSSKVRRCGTIRSSSRFA